MPTIKDSVFTEVALRRNAIEPEKLRQARETQNELETFGITKPIGMVIVDKALASRDVVREIAEEADSLWIRCPGCGKPGAVADADRHGRLTCGSCEQAIEYSSERIPEEDLALSLRPPNERRRSRKAPPPEPVKSPAGTPGPPRLQDRAPQGRKRTGPPGTHSKPRGQAAPREGEAGAALSMDHSRASDVTKFNVRGIIAASPGGRLYRIDGGGEIGALKLLDGVLGDKAQLKKWIKTMQVVQDLPRSANLKPMEFHREGSAAYVVRPYLEDARSLRAALDARAEEIRGAEAVVRSTEAMLGSLSSFHSLNLAHGNLKPENVLLRGEGACFTDPGLLILFQGLPAEERALRLWESSRYHAPEVLQGEEPGLASDVYSVGRMIQDLLEAEECAGRGSDETAWLARLAERMTAEDPVARHSSAKDVLWDFRARGGSRKPSNGGPAGGALAGLPGLTRGARRRSRAARLAGPAVLGAVLLGLVCQAAAWHATRKAMASPNRAEEVSSTLIDARIRELSRSTGTLDAAAAEKEWLELADTFRGTSWEGKIEEASRRPLEEASRRREKEVSSVVARALSLAERTEWPEAALCLLALDEEAADSAAAREALQRISDGLFEDEGMVLVTRGAAPSAGGETPTVGPFLIDAGLVTRDVRDAVRSRRPAASRGGERDGSPPATGISFDEAASIALALGKRLPTSAEWDRLAALARAPGGIEEISAKRIRDLGTLFEWVEDEAEDALSRAGHGWCRGGRRPGVPLTHPARRRKSSAHPDVGARFARDL